LAVVEFSPWLSLVPGGPRWAHVTISRPFAKFPLINAKSPWWGLVD
jgi:hypothetical protein